jgi:tRNA pseudouridine38-40 synthase
VPRALKLTIAYDGTEFAGWQRQADGVRTVQATIEDALLPLEGERVVLTGAGRTDSGVHADGQVASATLTRCVLPADRLQRALNAVLPADLRVMRIEDAAPRFNAQFDARQKTYRYWMIAGGVMPPAIRRLVWHVPQSLDVEAMSRAATVILGTHDFSAFQAAGGDVVTTVRTLHVSRVVTASTAPGPSIAGDERDDSPAGASGQRLCYEVCGTGFLRHMVRNIVGTLVDIGRGRRPVADMAATLASRDRSRASATAPPHGLTLWKVEY